MIYTVNCNIKLSAFQILGNLNLVDVVWLFLFVAIYWYGYPGWIKLYLSTFFQLRKWHYVEVRTHQFPHLLVKHSGSVRRIIPATGTGLKKVRHAETCSRVLGTSLTATHVEIFATTQETPQIPATVFCIHSFLLRSRSTKLVPNAIFADIAAVSAFLISGEEAASQKAAEKSRERLEAFKALSNVQ